MLASVSTTQKAPVTGRKLKCTLAVHALQPVVRQTSPRTHLLLRERFRNMASAGVSHGNTTHEAGMRLRCHAMPADKHDSQSSVGVVIVDHGSRKKTSNNMLVEFGQLYQQVTGTKNVQVAHMEIAEPTIAQGIDKCVAEGATTVVIAPYFLSKGRHIQEDIPKLVSEAQAHHPGVRCIIAEPIGIDPLMATLISSRVESALAKEEQATALLLPEPSN